jgi:hypothetical protein
MILSVNLIAEGRYWKAVDEVPDELVSPAVRKWAVANGAGEANAEEPAPRVN